MNSDKKINHIGQLAGKYESSNKIIKVDLPQPVRVRKYDVDIKSLQYILREHKILSNKDIAERLKIKKTTVDHWFRKDKCFSIPDGDIWFSLKQLLGIKTDEFDSCITEFEWKIGAYEKSERCYLTHGIAPTLTCSDEVKIIE